MYLLWHTQRAGWIARSGTTTTDLADAQEFDRAVALTRVRAQKDYTGAFLLIPVQKDDLA